MVICLGSLVYWCRKGAFYETNSHKHNKKKLSTSRSCDEYVPQLLDSVINMNILVVHAYSMNIIYIHFFLKIFVPKKTEFCRCTIYTNYPFPFKAFNLCKCSPRRNALIIIWLNQNGYYRDYFRIYAGFSVNLFIFKSRFDYLE